MRSRGFALGTVLIIIILVPIVVFGTTFFITNSLSRNDSQNLRMKAFYLAQAGLNKAIFGIESTGSLPAVSDWDTNNKISVAEVNPNACGIYQLKCTGIAVTPTKQVQRTLFAQFDSILNKVAIYQEGDGTGIASVYIYWPFSEGGSAITTATVPSNATYLGSLGPGAPNNPGWVAGKIGNALNFNSGATVNYVTVTDTAGSKLDLTTSGTVMAWINISTPVSGAGVVHKGNTLATSKCYGLIANRQNASNSRAQFWIYNLSNGTQYTASGTTNIPNNGTWHHIAGTWGPTGVYVYLDGVQNGSNVTANRSARVNNENLNIGVIVPSASATKFQGIIDEVYIYPCQKTTAEILAYYNATK